MKTKYFRNFMVFNAVAYILINILIFSIVPFAKLNNAQFWISWGFMFGVNIAAAIIIGIVFLKPDYPEIRKFPYYVFAGGNIIYLALGIIFTCLRPQILYVVITDICVAIIYALLIFKAISAVNYARNKKAFVKKKHSYIREITTLLESYASLAKDADMADELKKLSTDFRYSDPMSHESLADKEQKLMKQVISLEAEVRGGDSAKILASIANIKLELKLRNDKCADLK